MKFILLCFLIWHNSARSQVQLFNNSLIKPEVKVAYLFFENEIQVSGIPIDSNIVITSLTDTLKRYKDVFLYKPKISKKRIDTLTVFSHGSEIHRSIFTLEILEEPKIYFGKIRDSLVTIEYVLTNPGLILTYEPQLLKTDHYLDSFEAFVLKSNNDTISLSDSKYQKIPYWSDKKVERYFAKNDRHLFGGRKFTKEQLRKLKRTKSGDFIWFKTVIINCPDCAGRKKIVDIKMRVI